MKGKRTGIEFEQHEVIITQVEGLLVHHLKKPNTNTDNIKYINTNGILAVTGDYGNWIFCREFHPSADGGVSGAYWKEKLKILSTQQPNEFDEQGTVEEIDRLLAEEEDLDEEEIEYLTECKNKAGYGQFDYDAYAHRENCGRFQDHECVPHCMKTQYWLEAVFDGFDEMCRRIKEDNLIETK
jgi:hypothetical protein